MAKKIDFGGDEETPAERKANAEALKAAREMDGEKKKEAEQQAAPDDDEEIIIGATKKKPDDDDDDDDDDDGGPQLSRKEKKQRRLDTMIQAGVERELARRAPVQQPQYQPQQQGPDPLEQELEAAQEALVGLSTEYAAQKGLTPEQDAVYRRRWNALKVRETSAFNSMAARQRAPEEAQRNLQNQLSARYPDVTSNPSAWRWATAKYNQLIAENNPDGWATADRAVAAAREQFRIPNPHAAPRHTEASRSRLSGTARGAGGGRSADSEPRSFKMTSEHKKAALAAFPHFKHDPQKAYQAWVNGAGAAMVRAGVV